MGIALRRMRPGRSPQGLTPDFNFFPRPDVLRSRPLPKDAGEMSGSIVESGVAPADRVGRKSGGLPKAPPKIVVISMLAFAVMNVTTIVSLRGLPGQA